MLLLAAVTTPAAPAPVREDASFTTIDGGLARDGRIALYLPFEASKPLDFGHSSLQLEPAARRELDAVLKAMQKRPKLRLVVEGHAFSLATPEQNMALSDARAQAVVGALLKLGVDPNRLSFAAKGDTEPISQEKKEGPEVGRNERVELVDPDFTGVRAARGVETDMPGAKEPVLRRVPSFYISSFEEYDSWKGGRLARLGGLDLEGRATIVVYKHPDLDKASVRLPAPAQILSQYSQAARKEGGYEVHRSTYDAVYHLSTSPEGETWLAVEVLSMGAYRVTTVRKPIGR